MKLLDLTSLLMNHPAIKVDVNMYDENSVYYKSLPHYLVGYHYDGWDILYGGYISESYFLIMFDNTNYVEFSVKRCIETFARTHKPLLAFVNTRHLSFDKYHKSVSCLTTGFLMADIRLSRRGSNWLRTRRYKELFGWKI